MKIVTLSNTYNKYNNNNINNSTFNFFVVFQISIFLINKFIKITNI